MWKIIVSIALALFRWWTTPSSNTKVIKLQEKVDEITRTIMVLSKQPPTYGRLARIERLYNERLRLNRKIRRLRGK